MPSNKVVVQVRLRVHPKPVFTTTIVTPTLQKSWVLTGFVVMFGILIFPLIVELASSGGDSESGSTRVQSELSSSPTIPGTPTPDPTPVPPGYFETRQAGIKIPTPIPVRIISYGQEVTGSITGSAHDWEFSGVEGDTITIGLITSDMMLKLIDPKGATVGIVESNCILSSDPWSRVFRLANTGTYTIRVMGQCVATGGYSLRLTKP